MRRLAPLWVLLLLLLAAPAGAQEQPNRAALIVQPADGMLIEQCISFDEEEITGEELLHRSGLPVILDFSFGLGAAVCKIGEDGCDLSQGEECFCQCQGLECQYWAYFKGDDDGGWQYLSVGATGHPVTDGSVVGWRWVTGSSLDEGDASPPPTKRFEETCNEESSLATTSAVPVDEPASTDGLAVSTSNQPSLATFALFTGILAIVGVVVIRQRNRRVG